MSAVRCTAKGCGWVGRRKAAEGLATDTELDKGCPKCGGQVKVGGPAPTTVQTTPAGLRIAFWDSRNAESGLPQQRRYCVEVDGRWERFPSVSSIKGILGPKDALVPWAARVTREGLDWREEREIAAERGTQAHDLVLRAMLDEGASLSDLADEFRGWGQAAYRWLRHREPTVIAAELMVASVRHRFAGRFDLLAHKLRGLRPEVRVRVDFKTVSELKRDRAGEVYLPYAEHVIQLDAYELGARECGYPPADAGLLVRFAPDGAFDETFFALDPDRFLRVYGAYDALQEAEGAMRAGVPDLGVEEVAA